MDKVHMRDRNNRWRKKKEEETRASPMIQSTMTPTLDAANYALSIPFFEVH